MPRRKMPTFTLGQLESICKVLADTDSERTGSLTGTEIAQMLAQIGVNDPTPNLTKWKHLYNALAERQNSDQKGNRIFAFIACALEPARYEGKRHKFEEQRRRVNVTLSFLGYKYGDDGKFRKCKPASTLSEAEARANRLRELLTQRNVHPDVIEFCRAELLENDCFHAVLEACKSVAVKIRERTGLKSDGAPLVQEALGGNSPRLKINDFNTDTEKGEQRGFVNLTTGLFGTFRNPPAHEARILWPLSEEDALDLFALASYVHRRVDRAKVIK